MANVDEFVYEGGCLCGQVRFRVRQPQKQVIACHCRQCRRMSGHYFAASASDWKNIQMTETAGLAWYCSVDVSSRGFCNLCGSGLFFDHGPDQPLGIAAGAFDREPDFELAVHIWADEAGDSYRVTDDLPRYTEAEWRRDGWQRYRHGKDNA